MSEPKELFFLQVTDKNVSYRIGNDVSIQQLVNSLTSFFIDLEKKNPALASTIFTASAIAHFKDKKTAIEFRDHLNKVIESFKKPMYPYPLAEQAKQQENANGNSEAPTSN